MPLNLNQTFSSMNLSNQPRTNPYAPNHAATSLPSTSSSHVLYVGDLPPYFNELDLGKLLQDASIEPVSIKICRDPNTHESHRYAYVTFNTPEEAQQTIKQMNFIEVNGYTLRFQQYDKLQKNNPEANIFISNLAPEITARALYQFLQNIGTIESIKIPTVTNKDSQVLRMNYCFIQFATKEQAEKAIDVINTTTLQGEKFKATKYKPASERKHTEQNELDYVIKYIPCDMDTDVLFRELNIAVIEDSNKDHNNTSEDTNNKETITKFKRTEKKSSRTYVFIFLTFTDKKSIEIVEKNIISLNGKLKLKVDIPGFVYNNELTDITMEKIMSKADLINRKREQSMEQESKMRRRNIYVRGLPKSYGPSEFQSFCETFGPVESVWLGKADDLSEGYKNKGFGYCCYKESSSAVKAIECLNGTTLETRNLYVTLASPYKERRLKSMRARNHFRGRMGRGRPIGVQRGYRMGYNMNVREFDNGEDILDLLYDQIRNSEVEEEDVERVAEVILQVYGTGQVRSKLQNREELEGLINSIVEEYGKRGE